MSTLASPSEDNRKNELQDSMSKALDSIMANAEQSYDEFVGSFTYLRRSEVLTRPKITNSPKSEFTNKIKGANKINVELSADGRTNADQKIGANQKPYSPEELETEVLPEGAVSSRLSQNKLVRTGAAVKVDNFVDADEAVLETEDIDDVVATDGYMASFSADSAQPHCRASQQTNQSRDSPGNELTDGLFGQLSLDENSTDKLLLNFLADLQNEANEQSPAGNTDQCDSSMDIQQFLDKNKESKEEVTFSDDDDEAASNLLDNSDQGNVKVVVKPEELVDIENNKRDKPSVQQHEVLTDSEGVRIVGEPKGEIVEEAVEEPKDILFPGEAETTDDRPGTRHESLLDFKAICRESGTNGDEGSNKGDCSDRVEPFCLDANYDYDNVVLTPKFSQEDLQKLQTVTTKPL